MNPSLSRAGARRRSLVQSAMAHSSRNIGRKVARGAGYQLAGIVLRTVLTIGSTAVLARLLFPEDFGYIAMAAVVTEFAALFGAFGFGALLVQRRRICRLQLDTVFWASLGIGCALALLVFALSFASGLLFDDPRVGSLLRVLCLTFVLNSLATVPGVVIARLMRFRTEFWINLGVLLARGAAAIACAAAGLGVWSLVAGGLAAAAASAVLSLASVPFLPRRRFQLQLLTGTWRTSGSYLGNSLLYFVNTNIDLLLIGRTLGASSLGYYQNARTLTDEIRARIAMPIQHVLFPALSATQGEPERLRQLILRAGRWIAALVVPLGVGVSANAAELVALLYGPRWQPMVPLLVVFGLSAAVRAATSIASPIFNAADRVALGLRYNAITTAVMVGGILVAVPRGLEAVTVAVGLAALVSLVSCRRAFVLVGLNTKALLAVLAPPALASAGMWLAIAAVRHAGWAMHAAGALAVQVALGAVVYVALLLLMRPGFLQEVRKGRQLFLDRA